MKKWLLDQAGLEVTGERAPVGDLFTEPGTIPAIRLTDLPGTHDFGTLINFLRCYFTLRESTFTGFQNLLWLILPDEQFTTRSLLRRKLLSMRQTKRYITAIDRFHFVQTSSSLW